ncbi:MAG TPA: transglutaminase domain-containing protein [Methanobacteriaceae archaeon]|nr:transglutaminase domain-containing protein [Methanobacteriaceae archaeon]
MKKQHLLLIMLLLVTVTLSAPELYATPNQQTSDNISNTTNSTEVAVNSTNTTIIQNSTVNETVSDTINNQTTNNTTDTSNDLQKSTCDDSNQTANIQNSSSAAGDGTYNNVHGIWLSVDDVTNVNVDELVKAGITDVFVKANRITNPTYQSVLTTIIGKLQGTGIRVHAWVVCFLDTEGNWVDPQGTTYTVKVPYTETVKVAYTTWSKTWYKNWYQKWTKKWYKSGRSWKYKLTSIWTYYWKYGWTSIVQYKYETRTAYREETRYNSTQFNDALVNAIANMTQNYAIDGVQLDYVRYPGTAYKHSGGTETITAFVKRVHDTIKSIKPKVALSAALMPEGSVNGYYYGQDYEQLSQYLDFLVPMIYKGNYRQDTAWIGRTTAYISSHSNGKPVVAGLQTYRSDSDLTPLNASEVNQDIQSALSNGASGFALFRYGWLDKAFYQTQGTNTTPATTSFTLQQISDAAGRVKVYIEENQKLPNYVTLGSLQVSMPQFLYLLTAATSQANSGVFTPIALKSAADPTGPLEDMKNGTIDKSEFVDFANRIKSFMDSNRIAPNYASMSLGKIRYESLIYLYSRVMTYYGANSQLPNYASMKPWNTSSTPADPDPTVPDSLKAYLVATKNCQVNDPSIVALSNSITSGATTAYDKGLRIFNWVRDNLEYSWYYNSQKGAVNALSSRSANCCDHSNLIVALCRAAGVPARYVHGVCTFSSGTFGHVWAQVYANGKWYDADGTSSRNELGVIRNWNTNSWTLKGIYAELPF